MLHSGECLCAITPHYLLSGALSARSAHADMQGVAVASGRIKTFNFPPRTQFIAEEFLSLSLTRLAGMSR